MTNSIYPAQWPKQFAGFALLRGDIALAEKVYSERSSTTHKSEG